MTELDGIVGSSQMVTVKMWTQVEVRALIAATRCTHDEFAHDLGVTARMIDRWVSKTQDVVPRPVNQRALDTVLERADADAKARFVELTMGLPSIVYEDGDKPASVTRVLANGPATGSATQYASVEQPGEVYDGSTFLLGLENGGYRLVTSQAPSDARTPGPYGKGIDVEPGVPSPGDARNRERALIMSAADESAAFAQRAGQTNIHPSSLEQIESDIARISRDYLTKPLVPLVGEMRFVRNMTFAALEGRQYPSQTRQLYQFAAQLCGLLASASSDLAFYDAAQTQARAARMCTELADDPATESWVLSIQSLIAFWDERPTAAVERAVEGQSIASGQTDLLRLASLEARARARLGDLSRTREAIERGRAILETTDVERHSTIFDFPVANALRCFGSAYLWLGVYDEAQDALEQALLLFEAGPAEPESSYAHLAVTRIDLALARLGRGDIDAAEEILRPVLSLSPERRLSGIVRRSRDLHLALARPRYANAHRVRELTSEIEEYCSASARHTLSEAGE